MKTKLLILLLFFTVVNSFSQTETITIPWNFFAIPSDDPNYDENEFNVTIRYNIIGIDVLPQQLAFALQPTR